MITIPTPKKIQKCRHCGADTIYLQLISNDKRMAGYYCGSNCLSERRASLEPLPPITFEKKEEEEPDSVEVQAMKPEINMDETAAGIWSRLFGGSGR